MTAIRKRQDVLDEVEELAEELMEFEPSLTVEAARSYVFEGYPELYDEYRNARPGQPNEPVTKADPEPTLGEVILEAVRKQAWTRWPANSLEDLEFEVWQSDEGRVLYDKYRSDIGKLAYSEARREIAKSHDEAWSILEDWLAP